MAAKKKVNKDLPSTKTVKAVKEAVSKMQANKTTPKPTSTKPLAKTSLDAKNNKASIIQDITNRFSVTAREARDIVTAVGTAFQADMGNANKAAGGSGAARGPAGKNFVKQVKETVVAAKTGKKGTTSDIVPAYGNLVKQTVSSYTAGKKRK